MDECVEFIGSIIRQAALDYKYAERKGYIKNGKFTKWKINAWLYNSETITTAISFWHGGGLEQLCKWLPVDSSLIREKFQIFEK